MSKEIKQDRRHFLGTAVMTLAAGKLTTIGSAAAQSTTIQPAAMAPNRGASPSLGTLKQIEAGLLNIGYTEAGPAGGPALILLHGWPYDIHSFVDVAFRCSRPRATGPSTAASATTSRKKPPRPLRKRSTTSTRVAPDRRRRASRAATRLGG